MKIAQIKLNKNDRFINEYQTIDLYDNKNSESNVDRFSLQLVSENRDYRKPFTYDSYCELIKKALNYASIEEINFLNDIQVYNRKDLEDIIKFVSFENSVIDFKWKFEVVNASIDNKNGFAVRATFERPDTHTNKIGRGYGRWEFIPMNSTESYVYFTCHLLVELLIRHETYEGERYMGRRPLYPHTSVHRLSSLSAHIK